MAGPFSVEGLNCESCLERWGRVMISLCLTCTLKAKDRAPEVRGLLKTFSALSGGEKKKMDSIPFPSGYRDGLAEGRMCMTIRVKEELNKYRVGECYSVVTFDGLPLGVTLRVVRIEESVVGQPGILLDSCIKNHGGFRYTGPIEIVWFLSGISIKRGGDNGRA